MFLLAFVATGGSMLIMPYTTERGSISQTSFGDGSLEKILTGLKQNTVLTSFK